MWVRDIKCFHVPKNEGVTNVATNTNGNVGHKFSTVYGWRPIINSQGGGYLFHHGIVPERRYYHVYWEMWGWRVC